ncbi:MAG: DUF2178 domain-containing protein [Patescibacteria group bacterium]
MNKKQYTICRLAIIIILSFTISYSMQIKNYILPITALIGSVFILFYLRKKVDIIIADERDYVLAGDAARYTLTSYSFLAVIFSFILYSLQDINPYFYTIALVLNYSVCFLLILYSLIFKFYNNIASLDKKKKYINFVIYFFIVLLIILFGLRLFSGEDNWVCQNGKWVKHGNPDFAAPLIECKK